MKTKLFTLFVALIATTALWAQNNVITYTATEKLTRNFGSKTFGPTIISHTFSNGIGTITCNGEITTIGESAFYDCIGLTSVTIPNSVTTIKYDAFRDCSSLTSVTIPNSVTTIGEEAFYGCTSLPVLNNLRYADTYLVEAVDKTLSTYTIEDGTKWIGDHAFQNCSRLTSVTIPNSVTTIGEYAFSNCTGLTSITIPNSVTAIEDGAFYGCSSLTSVTISNSIKTIRTSVFGACSGLTSVTIPNSVITIGNRAFSGCSGLTSVTIPNSVTTIGEEAFRACTSLNSIKIPNSVTSINYTAFSSCTSLPIIDGIRYADTYLIAAVDKTLSSYTIKDGTRWIGYRAFQDCANMTSITIPDSIEVIEDYAFTGCTSLPIINNIRYADTYLIEAIDKTLSSYSIKNGTRWIGESAFNKCTNLTSITIPYSVISLGNDAFYDCSELTTITIPNWTSVGYFCLGHSYTSIKDKTIYVILSPFEHDINPNIKELSEYGIKTTYITQPAEVATWTTTPTTIEMDIDLTYIPTTALYDSISIDYFGEENDIEKILTPSTKNHVIFTGLTPNQKANIYYTSKKIGENDWKEGAKLEIQLPKLNLTTLTPKVVSAGTAVVAAETNISDYETNVGFEWRKYDAPESMPSKSGAAILFNGMMEGKLLNLSTDAYWNVRPYYEAADGTRHYGEWITFDPSDFSYFEPTVHTYALAMSPTANNVQVRGYVMTGTDDVTEQGFEYWFKGGQKAPHRAPAATPDSIYRVTASGQVMSAVLEDLAYSSTYTCRAYAIAGGKTYYGEEVQFLTPEDPRPIYTLTVIAGENGSVNAEVSGQYREGEQVTLTATPNVGYLFEQWSDGNTENPYILTIMQDTEIMATFKEVLSGWQDIHSGIKATKFLHNGNLIIERNGIKYTATGQKVL